MNKHFSKIIVITYRRKMITLIIILALPGDMSRIAFNNMHVAFRVCHKAPPLIIIIIIFRIAFNIMCADLSKRHKAPIIIIFSIAFNDMHDDFNVSQSALPPCLIIIIIIIFGIVFNNMHADFRKCQRPPPHHHHCHHHCL